MDKFYQKKIGRFFHKHDQKVIFCVLCFIDTVVWRYLFVALVKFVFALKINVHPFDADLINRSLFHPAVTVSLYVPQDLSTRWQHSSDYIHIISSWRSLSERWVNTVYHLTLWCQYWSFYVCIKSGINTLYLCKTVWNSQSV